jgi:hypothetical protein
MVGFSWWGTSTEESTPEAVESQETSEEALLEFSRKVRPWFVLLLVLQAILLVLRWRMGDAHGALLMFAVCAVGVLAVSVGPGGGVDAIYGGYFGLMSFVSGLLDLNLAIEGIIWSQWSHQLRTAHKRGSLSSEEMAALVRPAMYLVCAAVQIASAFVAYLLYKEAELFEDGESDDIFASADQARVSNAVLTHSQRRSASLRGADAPHPCDSLKAFDGRPQKLPM